MEAIEDEYVLECPLCGSHSFAVNDTTTEDTFVYCADCGAEVGQLDDFINVVKTRLSNRQRERRKQQAH
jgi:DNA-directed RNA polymerase subunit RPC12/RpoP